MKELTKNRAQLLRLFFTNPDQSFYMQEIGRILGKKPGNFQRVINSMEREGVLVSERKANARYFKANKEYPLYEEYKNIIFKTVGAAGSIKGVLQKAGGVDYAFIYGSYAKAKEGYLSDIDLIVIGKCDEDVLIKNLDSLEDVLKREINYKLYTPGDFKKEIKLKEPFLLNILQDKKIMLIGDENDLRKILKG
ncbi:MAG: nucleotidyltransferase domain-containing protein [Candidatus Omnitrophica bacterium]|nr:nucleotidyltransferase domain-containing protein [Candidatus Omnitrophota bacterium]